MKGLKKIGIVVMVLLVSLVMISSASGEPNVARDLPATVQPGDEFTVTLDVTLNGADKELIEDNVPSGWTITDAPGGSITTSGETVSWVSTGAPQTSYTYTVEVPGDAADGMYDFSGEFSIQQDQSLTAISGDTQVEVVTDGVEPSEPSVVRDLPATVQPGNELTVTLNVANHAAANKELIEDNVPSGWTITGAPGGSIATSGEKVSWVSVGTPQTSYTYTVEVPGDAADGMYDFSGEFSIQQGQSLTAISGDTQVEVVTVEGMDLKEGWNFISVPYVLENSSVDYVFADIEYDALLYYNAGTDVWEIPDDLEPLKGYWIKSNEMQIVEEDLLEAKAAAVPAAMTVYPGWNSIGYTSMDPLPAELALSSIDDSYTTIKGPWNPDTNSYEKTGHNGQSGVINGSHVGTDVFEMSPYEGYWVYVTQESTLSSL